MIETIEDAFGTHNQQDGQAKANGASECSGIGLAEAMEDIPRRTELSKLHAEEP
jgi:hypothetical protein